MEPIVLYQLETCPYCIKVKEKLEDLGVEYETENIDPGDREEVKEMSGQRNVPVIVDPNADKVINESNDIVEYLEEKYG